MNRLIAVAVLLILLFNWIGFQLYTTIADQYINKTSSETPDQDDSPESGEVPYKIPGFHISTYSKILDFDDLFEFESRQNYSANEIALNISNDLFPDHANKSNRNATFKCFNGEYYSRPDRFTKYPVEYSTGKIPDRYLLKIPVIFLSPKDHPPQYLA